MEINLSNIGNYAYIMNSQSRQKSFDGLFSKIDTNSDNTVDETELSSFLEDISTISGKSFDVKDILSTYDADENGSLSKDELQSFMKENVPPPPHMKQREDIFSKIDTNGDDSIDETEFEEFTSKMSEITGKSMDTDSFSLYDTDGDGVLSKDELNNFMKENFQPPPPPHNMNSAASAYSSINESDQISSAIDSLINQLSSNGSDSSFSSTLLKLFSIWNSQRESGYSNLLNIEV
ncbi:EF-hand domain-containing protein [Thermodesulfovibrio yellowstonii]|uniref:Calcium-binding EF-hand n=1 Tax=Thermodesulfovibrio yellowstonii TaxID=28262 RepID=A0A9W6GFX7_9BACT|nr:EF-hand domain-containing protein [Thermodesulfovibrio islandicus]GLI53203.1 calcium-binding EF-hand [Thermodesulfovibrio islandicus]